MPNRINDAIKGVNEVRLVGDNVEQGIYSFKEAMRIADAQNLDLVEISASAVPPVCRVIDYQKFLYQKKRKEKEQKQNSKKIEIKEIRFGPQTDEHDYNFKLRHAQEFLKDGNKVKAYVFFRGRSILFKEQGEVLLLRFANDLEEYGKVEQMPRLEGKKMFLFIAPKKAGQAKKSQQKMDREKREAEANALNASQNAKAEQQVEKSGDGLAANAKGLEALAALKFDDSE